MSGKPYYQEENATIHLRTWAFGQMVWGAFLAGAFLAVFAVAFYALVFIGSFLPPESKEAPSPYGAIETTIVLDVMTA